MTINYIHIYDLLAGGPITGVKVYIRVQGEESSKFNDIHSFLELDMKVCTYYIYVSWLKVTSKEWTYVHFPYTSSERMKLIHFSTNPD